MTTKLRSVAQAATESCSTHLIGSRDADHTWSPDDQLYTRTATMLDLDHDPVTSGGPKFSASPGSYSTLPPNMLTDQSYCLREEKIISCQIPDMSLIIHKGQVDVGALDEREYLKHHL